MGAIGAVVGIVIGSVLWLHSSGSLFEAAPEITSYPAVLVCGVLMGVIGLVGDLCESLIKRDVQKKDSAVGILRLVALVHDAGMKHVNFFHYNDKPRQILELQATVKATRKEDLPEEEVIEEVLEEIPIELE